MSISRLYTVAIYEYFKNINSGYYEWLSGAREYMSSAESALLREWCMRVVHEGSAQEWCTRTSGAWVEVVHENGARVWVVHEMGTREYVAVHE